MRVAQVGIYRRFRSLSGMLLAPDTRVRTYMARALLVVTVGTALLMTTLLATGSLAPQVDAQALRISPSASCAQLGRSDPTVTNGQSWGRTVLAGHGAAGGWFGVDVCSNGFNSISPNGSNVSCDSVSHGCSPTSDGYGWTFQCPELIVRFSSWAFGDSPGSWGRSGWGNAPDLWLPVNHPSDFVMYRNGSNTAPVPGDILIWGFLDGNGNPWPAGPDGSHGGHIAVVAAVRNGMVITAEENVKWGNQDHPSDALALTHVGSHWVLSGSTQHTTTLPTWRWLRTMGHSRGTFGWLHSVKNNSHFPNTHARSSSGATAKTPANSNTLSQQFPGGLPSLSSATVVTRSGTLADLTWSTQSLFAPASDASQPQAQVRSLGTPPGSIRLASGQSAATLLMSNGSRYTYVLGTDGNLYAARTAPTSLGVFWTGLGQPSGITLVGSPVASLFAGGVQIAARGADGNLWWRAGPPDHPGNWTSLAAPSTSALSDNLALAGAPGTGTPVVYALGVDGRLYTRIWQDATTAVDGTQIPAAWSTWLAIGAESSSSRLAGNLVVVPELPNAHSWIGPWPDSPLNILAADSNGTLWWFRSTRLSTGYTTTAVAGNPAQLSALLGAVAVPAAPAASASATGSTSNAPQAEIIELYASARAASYMATVTIPSAGKASAGTPADKPIWAKLPDPPAGVDPSVQGAALALGAGNSVLVTAAGDDVVIGGVQAMTAALLSQTAPQVSGGKLAANPWMRVGAAPAASTFSDAFTAAHLDTRWTRTDPAARVTLDANGLSLAPSTRGVAALMQSASAGDTTLSVEIGRPDTLSARDNVGLVLYEDDADWLTFTVDRTGVLRFCAMLQQSAQPCITGKANARAPVWLRIQRSASTFTALSSADGATWQMAGQWTPTSVAASKTTQPASGTPGARSATATSTANATATSGATVASDPATASLAFTAWGVIATSDGKASVWPHITNFTVQPAS